MIATIAFEELHSFLGISAMEQDITLVDALATPERDARVLYHLVKTLAPEFILEIGTFYGHTTYGLAVNSPGSKIYTLDICREMGIAVPAYQERELLPRDEVGTLFKGKGLDIVQVFGDSRKPETYQSFPVFDFIFIDGNHDIDAIIADTTNAVQRTSKGSVICWHDYPIDGDGLAHVEEALTIVSDRLAIEIQHIAGTLLAIAVI